MSKSSAMMGGRSNTFPRLAGEDTMKALIQELSRRFGTLPKGYRALIAGALAVFVLYNAVDVGLAAGRALYYLSH
ncbi:MAG: hypothetical protein AB1584_01425 [Pseudomonadota bacterium]